MPAAISPSSRAGPIRAVAPAITFALALALCLLVLGGRLKTADEIAVYGLAYNLAQRGAVDVDILASSAPGMTRPPATGVGAFGPDGHFYSGKGILTSLLAAPLVWIGLAVPGADPVGLALMANVLATALAAATITWQVQRQGYPGRSAIASGLAYVAATSALAYGKTLFTEPAAAACIAAAFAVLSGAPDRPPPRRAWLRPVAAGVIFGGAIAASYSNAVLLPCFLAVACAVGARTGHRGRRAMLPLLRAPLLFVAGMVPWALALGIYNQARFGSPFQTGLSLLEWSLPYFSLPAAMVRIYGLLVSPYRGLLPYNPVLLLAPAALLLAARAAPHRLRNAHSLAALAMAGAATAGYLLFFSFWSMWWGGFNWGPRFLVPVLPLWLVGLAPVFERLTAWPATPGAGGHTVRRAAGFSLGWLALATSTGVAVLGAAADIYPSEGTLARQGMLQALVQPESLAASPLLTDWAYFQAVPAWRRVASGDLDVMWRAGDDDAEARLALRRALADIAERAGPGSSVVLMAPSRTEMVLHDYRLAAPLVGLAADQITTGAEAPARPLLQRARVLLLTDAGQSDSGNTTERWLESRAFRARNEFFAPFRSAAFGVVAGQALADAPGTPIHFGPRLQLEALAWSPTAMPGGAVALAAQWRRAAITDSLEGVAWFAHLVGPDGQLVAQHDALIGGGYGWAGGEQAQDHRGVLIPQGTPPGRYTVQIGVYGAGGERFPASGAGLADPVYSILVDIVEAGQAGYSSARQ